MSDHCPPTDRRKLAATRDGARRRLFLGLVAFTIIRAGEALAADQAVHLAPTPGRNDARPPTPASAAPFAPFAPFAPQFSSWTALSPVPREYALPPMAESRSFSNKDFRPRGHSVFDTDLGTVGAGDNLMIDRTAWDRLQEFRNRDGFRVLTLWESRVSAVSIQTNRRGDHSLQWTSRLMNRGGATRGLLDRWMPASVFRSFSRSPAAASGKTPSPLAVPHPGIAAPP
jgi:hypothetical protein